MQSRLPGRLFGRLSVFAVSVATNGVVSIFAIPLLVHGVGAQTWAAMATGQVIGGVASAVVAWGWGVVGAAEVAALPSGLRLTYFRQSLGIRLSLLGPAAAIAGTASVMLCHRSGATAAGVAVATTVSGVSASWFFVGVGQPAGLLWFDTAPRGVATVLGVIAVGLGASALVYPLLLLLGTCLGALLGTVRVLQMRSPSQIEACIPVNSGSLLNKGSRQVLLRQAPAVAGTLLAATYLSLPLTFVAGLAPSAVPTYAIADKLLRLALAAATPLAQVTQGWVPSAGEQELPGRVSRAFRLVGALSLVAAVVFALVAPLIGYALTGGAISLSIALSIPLGLAFGSSILTQTVGLACLVPLGRGRAFVQAALLGAGVTLPLQLVLTPRCGGTGSAWAVAAAEMSVLMWEVFILRRALKRPA